MNHMTCMHARMTVAKPIDTALLSAVKNKEGFSCHVVTWVVTLRPLGVRGFASLPIITLDRKH